MIFALFYIRFVFVLLVSCTVAQDFIVISTAKNECDFIFNLQAFLVQSLKLNG